MPDCCFFFFCKQWGVSLWTLKCCCIISSAFVVGDLALDIAGSKNPEVSLAVKVWVLSVKVMSNWNTAIMRSSKIPSFIYLQNEIFVLTHYHRNANQNHNEVPSHASQMAAIQKSTGNKCWRGCGEKGTFLYCWWECKLE